ncbi:MAG: 2-dehydropantoate 2-reductase [Paludibacter sp.]|nr:2-dehydropantoate 2-reductase [Paludibacter sp.]MBP7612964.1 2-dehydropantoate 2-reductase [Paludibacter sp.]
MKTKIVIVGLGGVGGYYGGMLAKQYADNPEIEIYFVARGAHLRKVQENGLTLITEKGTFQVHPTLATNDVTEIGTADYIIMTPKSYDLDATVEQIKPIVGSNTVILPLLNGIDNSDRIRTLLPDTEVWQGCCYIVARLNEPGVVESSGGLHRFNFGYEYKQNNERLIGFETLLKEAGIDATFHEKIMHVIWTKFFFISSTASLTSYFDVSFGALLTDEVRKATLVSVLEELLLVANAEGAEIEHTVIDKVIHQLEKLPFETTASMHSDFKAGKNTEVHGLTGAVIQLAKKHAIATPTYEKVYAELCGRMKK